MLQCKLWPSIARVNGQLDPLHAASKHTAPINYTRPSPHKHSPDGAACARKQTSVYSLLLSLVSPVQHLTAGNCYLCSLARAQNNKLYHSARLQANFNVLVNFKQQTVKLLQMKIDKTNTLKFCKLIYNIHKPNPSETSPYTLASKLDNSNCALRSDVDRVKRF